MRRFRLGRSENYRTGIAIADAAWARAYWLTLVPIYGTLCVFAAWRRTGQFTGTVIRRSLEPFVDLVTDVLSNPGLAGAELGRLRRETEAELADVRDNDQALARRWFRRKLFSGHPYGRPVIG